MVGGLLGAKIDDHDTIIRINRLTTFSYVDDFGSRTDIMFGNHYEAKTGTVTLMGEIDMQNGRARDYPSADCSSKHRAQCPVEEDVVFVFKDDGSSSKQLKKKWKKAKFQVGLQHHNISLAAKAVMAALSDTNVTLKPSTGMHAFFTFAPLCDKMTMYGFTGEETADGHSEESSHHSVSTEHSFYRMIIAGTVPRSLWPSKWYRIHVPRCKLKMGGKYVDA
eukprot:NODE_2936_length_853_cov_372.249373.p1 GENE.NODE_2936_length_853_cov_372.249373~~NODE_2936_length_853_cov_372.249373.p1  ORF type:complete len:247 (+),score=95.05 NODE_2936_length_853_cov_372.249373:79-741(+)